MSLVVLSFFRRHCDRERRATRPLARAAYGAFVLQAPVLVGIALALHPLELSPEAKFALLAAGGVTVSFAAAWLAITAAAKLGRRNASAEPRQPLG
jgi:peptidoglycan/LPS O-acetylase OafA/YrhL